MIREVVVFVGDDDVLFRIVWLCECWVVVLFVLVLGFVFVGVEYD